MFYCMTHGQEHDLVGGPDCVAGPHPDFWCLGCRRAFADLETLRNHPDCPTWPAAPAPKP